MTPKRVDFYSTALLKKIHFGTHGDLGIPNHIINSIVYLWFTLNLIYYSNRQSNNMSLFDRLNSYEPTTCLLSAISLFHNAAEWQ